MHKIILSLLIILSVPTHAMLWFTPNLSFTYKRSGSGKTTLFDIPNDMFFFHMFQKADELCELATLIKKFGDQTNTKELLPLFSENLLSLLHLSQTNTYFHNRLANKIKNRTELSRVSCNSIVTYLDCHGFFDTRIFRLKYKNSKTNLHFFLSLIRKNKGCKELQMYDKNNQYINIYNLCTRIINTDKISQEIKNVCAALQNECSAMRNLSEKNVNKLTDLLLKDKKYDYLKEFNKYSCLGKLICPTILQLHIFSYDNNPDTDNTMKNIKSSFLDNEDLVFILSKHTSIHVDILKYLRAYNSFVQILRPCTLISENPGSLIFETDCGLSDTPTIPVDIICPERLVMKDK